MHKVSNFLVVLISFFVLPNVNASEPIKIAVVGALSGQFKNVGMEFKQGVGSAVQMINAKGGVLGRSLQVSEHDDECNPEKARQIAKDIVKNGISMVVGHLCSGASIAASDVYAANGIVQISPASTAPQFTDRGLANVFRTCGRDDMQGFVVAEHMARRYRTKAIGIVADTSVYSTELAKLTKQSLKRAGISVAMDRQVPKNTVDFNAIMDEIKKLGIEVLFFPSYAQQATIVLKEAKKRGIKLKFVGSDTLMNDDFLNLAGNLTDGVELSFPPDPSHDRRNRKLTRQLKEKGFNPEAFTFYTYAAVEVWAQAVTAAKKLDVNAVVSVLRKNKIDTVLGRITFDSKGDVSQPGFVMYRYIDGEPDYIQ